MLNKLDKYSILFIIILLIGIVLRVYNINNWYFSNDELSALSRTVYTSFLDLINDGVSNSDVHPPAAQVIIYYAKKWLGDSEIAIKLPFTLFSIISIVYAFLLASKWFSKETGIYVASVLACFFFPLLYSQLARPYSLGLLSCLGAAYHLQFIRQKNIYHSIAFIMWGALCFYSHYFAGLLFCLIVAFDWIDLKKEDFKPVLINYLLIGFLLIPVVSIFITQINKEGLSWLTSPDITFIKDHIMLWFNNSTIIIILVFIGISKGIIYNKTHGISVLNKNHIKTILPPLFLFVIGYIYSVLKQPVLQHSGLLFAFPFFMMFILSFFPQNKTSLYIFTPIILILGTTTSIYSNNFYNSKHFGVFEELAEKTLEWQKAYGKNNITNIAQVNKQWYLDYYYNKSDVKVDTKISKFETKEDLRGLRDLLEKGETDYISFSWSSAGVNPEIYDIILNYYPTIVDHTIFYNAASTLFSKSISPRNYLFSSIYDAEKSEIDHWNINTQFIDTTHHFIGQNSEKLNKDQQYSSGFEAPLEIFNQPLDSIYICCQLQGFYTDTCSATLVIQFMRDNETIEWYGADIETYINKPNTWIKTYCSRQIPKNCILSDKVKIYVWNRGKHDFYIDNFSVAVSSIKNIPL